MFPIQFVAAVQVLSFHQQLNEIFPIQLVAVVVQFQVLINK